MPQNISSRTLRASLSASAAVSALLFTAGSAAALTEAGQRIQNQATATYKDALGNDYTAQSNLASVEVRQVYFATLESDGARTVASNQTAYFQHTLTNTGNGEDTYSISVAQDIAGATDSGDFSTLEVYVDENDNGVVDAGELPVTSYTLAAGEQVSLVVAGLVPTATPGNTFDATLTVTTANGTVEDLTDAKGIDGADETNEDRATVSGDAVLNVFKSSVHDEVNNTITYTVTVTNTGNTAAEDVVLFDGLPEGTVLVGSSVSASGFGTAIDANDTDLSATAVVLDEAILNGGVGVDLNGDGDTTDAGESALGIDLNTDGDTADTAISGIFGIDDVLPPATSVEFNFTVSYDPAVLGAGELIENIGHVSADLDGIPGPDGTVPSTKTTDVVPQNFAVTVTDTGIGANATANDGGDDDGVGGNTSANAGEDSQQVDTAQAGELVFFTHIITNTGNGTDTFELEVDNISGFPPGTSYTIWNETGTVQLLNTNGEGGVDTGPMDAGDVLTVRVQVQLPPNGSRSTPSTYDLIATSAEDPSSTPASDDTEGELLEIVAPTVDLSNSASDGNIAVNQDVFNIGDNPITTQSANPGDMVTFPLFIQNDSQVADSFQLSAGGTFTSVNNPLGALPAGWSVTFRDAGGSVITTTPSIASGGSLAITADVMIPSLEAQALADYSAAIDSATVRSLDGGSGTGAGDGDGDYGIFFRVVSVNSGAADVKLDAVDVLPNEELTLLQDNAGQIQPGGSIDYPHTLQNDGNTDERVTLSASNGTNNWSNNLLVDTTGDGQPDTPFASLGNGASFFILDETGTLKSVTLDADLTFPLEPGESVDFVVRVFAPTSAPNGQLDIVTVTASYNGGTDDVTNVDRSEVVEAQLRLLKTASVDADCAGATTTDLGPDGPFTENTNQADPGDCVVWQVVATNAGVDTLTDVEITDSIPDFSTYETGTLRICEGNAGQSAVAACTFSTLSDGTGDDEGQFSSGDIRYTLGAGTAPELAISTIPSGESVTVRFSSEVE
ncbi:MAG: hypothetical protein AAGH90_02335 [Pseudomonadota bacterium]